MEEVGHWPISPRGVSSRVGPALRSRFDFMIARTADTTGNRLSVNPERPLCARSGRSTAVTLDVDGVQVVVNGSCSRAGTRSRSPRGRRRRFPERQWALNTCHEPSAGSAYPTVGTRQMRLTPSWRAKITPPWRARPRPRFPPAPGPDARCRRRCGAATA